MKEFINIVIKIAFNNLYLHQHNPEAKLRYEELFKQDINPQDPDFSNKIEKYINQYVLNQDHFENSQAFNSFSHIQEQCDQMFFSSLVTMFRILKLIRVQDNLGSSPQQRFLFAVACIAAANQCDTNILGKPLFLKSLSKATFIAQNYAEMWTACSNPTDSVGLLSYEQWTEMFYDYLIQIYNGVLQTLDLQLEVTYPIEYILRAIPPDNPSRDDLLTISRQHLLYGEQWLLRIQQSLFYHPRELAFDLFQQAIQIRKEE